MEKVLYILCVVIFTGCASSTLQVDEPQSSVTQETTQMYQELQTKIQDKNRKIMELQEKNKKLEEKSKKLEEEKNTLRESYHEKTSKMKEQLEKLQENSYKENRDIRNTMMRYFKEERKEIERKVAYADNAENDFLANGIRLYMTQEEVKKILGDGYSERISYEVDSGHFLIHWTYEDGTVLKFNPIYLVGYRFNSTEYTTNLGIQIGDNALEGIAMLDTIYERYSNIRELNNSESVFDFYYDKKTNTAIFLITDTGETDFDTIDATTKIAMIGIDDYDWLHFE